MEREPETRALGVSGHGDRMFLAVALDDESRHAIAAHLDEFLGGKRLPGRPVRPDNWHITLRFLGPTETRQAEQIVAHLDQHLMVGPHRVRLGGLGGFPKEQRAAQPRRRERAVGDL